MTRANTNPSFRYLKILPAGYQKIVGAPVKDFDTCASVLTAVPGIIEVALVLIRKHGFQFINDLCRWLAMKQV